MNEQQKTGQKVPFRFNPPVVSLAASGEVTPWERPFAKADPEFGPNAVINERGVTATLTQGIEVEYTQRPDHVYVGIFATSEKFSTNPTQFSGREKIGELCTLEGDKLTLELPHQKLIAKLTVVDQPVMSTDEIVPPKANFDLNFSKTGTDMLEIGHYSKE